MTIVVNTPDGGVANFPDDTSKDAIRNAMRAKFGGGPAKDVAQKVQSQSGGEDLAYRGSILPVGKTKEGKIVPAMPQFAVDFMKAVKSGVDTGDLTPKQALDIASIVSPDAKVGLEALGEAGSALRGLKKPEIPATQELKAQSTAAYNATKQAGVQIKPEAFRSMVSDIIPDIKQAGFDKDIQPQAAAALRRLQSEIELGSSPTLPELDILRQVAGSAAQSPSANERRISRIITSKMDDFLDNLKSEDVSGGDTAGSVQSLKTARELWRRQAKSNEIDELFEKAALRAPGTPAEGFEGQVRKQFKALSENPKRLRKFSADEQEAIKQIATGGKMQNALTKIGKFSPTAGFFSAALSGGIAADALQRPELLAVPALGGIARWAAGKLRLARANKLKEMVRGGKAAANYFNQRSNLTGRALDSAYGAAVRPGLAVGSSLLPDQSSQ